MIESLIALITLTALEIVLGVDNIIFITILASRLPAHEQAWGRRLGIAIAVVGRLLLLTLINWIQQLRHVVALVVLGHPLTYRSLVLIAGGLFLLAKSTHEIHARLEAEEPEQGHRPPNRLTLPAMLVQVALIDMVFSLDSVITAVGIANQFWVMVTAILVAASIMIIAVDAINRFMEQHPSMKMLGLSFLVLIGAVLIAEGWSPEQAEALGLKNYAYFAMAFSFFVELLNIRLYRRRTQPVRLHRTPRVKTTSAGKPQSPPESTLG